MRAFSAALPQLPGKALRSQAPISRQHRMRVVCPETAITSYVRHPLLEQPGYRLVTEIVGPKVRQPCPPASLLASVFHLELERCRCLSEQGKLLFSCSRIYQCRRSKL